ncbi:hypothetical protein AMS68_001986 [Peltaster fructicola]|uniref:Involucrin repeat protein n=1 Tax=Peltaster fructicola TaxID=286661 RepID=A0A6H0XPC3_9PEZI|nr:hypothetical protein AMS68_001986 [Peltaster fructicola]
MWKAFSGRSERDGDRDRKQEGTSSSGRRRHRTDDDGASVVTSASRRTDSSRKKRHHDREDDQRDKSSRRDGPSGLTEGALRALDDNDEAWEDDDDDLKSERRSKRSGKDRSERDEKDRRKEKDRVKEPERRSTRDDDRDRKSERRSAHDDDRVREPERRSTRDDDREKDSRRKSLDQKSSLSKSRGKSRAEDLVDDAESSRALPAMGSFDQFPGMYDAAVVRPPERIEHTMSGALPLDSHIPNQFPGQMPSTYTVPAAQLNPHGEAADYYNDQGESVHHQPGVRPNTPMMLHNPDSHLITPSAAANPVADTGNGAAADFYGGKISPVSFQVEPSVGPGSTPARPAKKPSNAIGATAAAVTAAAIGGLVNKHSSRPSATTMPSKPSRHNSAPSFAPGGGVYSAPPAVTGKLEGTNLQTNNAGLYTAAGAAALGAAAYGLSQQHSNGEYAYMGQPQGPSGQDSYYAPPGGVQTEMNRDYHEHRGPIERLKDGILDMIANPDDVRKMEAYTEYIGVCKQCFDPRSSPWDGPRRHHYHPRRRDSFESLRKRASRDGLRRKNSGERLGGTSRVEKEARYAASESSRRRQGMSKAEMAGLGALGAGAVTTGAMLWRDGKDFDDYSIKTGHRPGSVVRRTSRSSSRERRRRSSYGVIGPDRQEKEKWVTVRTKDGRTERRKVFARSRSRSRSHGSRDRASGWIRTAAGAALGATAASLANRSSPERKRREEDKVFVRRKSNARSRSRSSSPGMGFFGSFKDKRSRQQGRRSPTSPRYSTSRRDSRSRQDDSLFGGFFADSRPRKEHRKKEQGFFSFGNGSASSLDSELAFGEGHHSRSSLGRKASNSSLKSRRKVNRRTSEERMTAAVAGIGATAAALAAAQRGQRLSRHPSKPELGARREAREIVDGRSVAVAEDNDWEDELPSDVDDASSHDGDLAFGHHDRRGRMSRQSMESIASNSSAGGLSAWGWRWGSKRKASKKPSAPTRQSAYPQDFRPYHDQQSAAPQGHAYRQASTSGPQPPMQYVDPRPVSENNSTPGSRHASMPGAFDSYDSPALQRPGVAPLQQPQPIAPIFPAFTQGLNDDPLRSLASSRTPTKPRRTQSSPTRNGYGSMVGDAAIIGGAALATAGIIAAQNKKSKDSGNVRFGLTDEQQRKDNEARRREQEREVNRQREREADERRKAERAEAVKEEARRAARDEDRRREQEQRAREEEQRRMRGQEQRAREAQQEAERRAAREEEQRRIREQEQRARDAQQDAERRTRENREREYAAIAAAEEERRRAAARAQAEQVAEAEKRRREYEDQARAAEEEARHRARWEAEEQARREAHDRDRRDREIAHSRDSHEPADSPRGEETRAFEGEEDRERRRRDRQRELDEQDRFDEEHRHSKKSQRKSSLSRDRGSRDSPSSESSKAWQAPVAAGIAGAVTGAILDGALHKEARRSDSPDDYSHKKVSSPSHDQSVAAKIVEPSNEHSGAPITDDDLFDPSFFSRRKRSASETARQVEVARNAAEKIISDREAYYNAPTQTQAEIFAPPELLNRAAGEKERSTDPMGGNEVQVWHASEAEVRQHFEHPMYRDHPDNGVNWLARSIPKLNVIAPTPPPSHSPFQKPKQEPQVAAGAEKSAPTESDDASHQRRQRAVSWGQDQTHIYQVQTPDSMIDKESYVTAHDIPYAASTPLDDEIVVEVDEEDGNSKTTRYSKDVLTGASPKIGSSTRDVSDKAEAEDDVEEIDREADEAADAQYFARSSDFKYKQPFFDSVSDVDIAVDSPGTEGAPPVRGWVDDEEITSPTPKDEKAPELPQPAEGAANTGNDRPPKSNQREIEDSKQASKPQSTFGFASLVGAAMGAVGAKASTTAAEPVGEVAKPVEEDAWEPPLSKKEKKKREKLAKRQSISEEVPETVLAEDEPVREASVEPAPEPVADAKSQFDDDFPTRTLSKKDKKKRDKAAKRASLVDDEADLVEPKAVEEIVPPTNVQPAVVDDLAFEVPLSKKDKKKREKLAKRGVSFDDDSFPSTPASEQEEPDLGRATTATAEHRPTVDDDIAYEMPLSKKEKKKREKLAKRGLSFDDDSSPSTPASEREEPDHNTASAEAPEDRALTEAERDRAEKMFGKQQGIGDVVSAMMTAGGIAALAGASNRSNENSTERSTERAPAEEEEDDLWATPAKKGKKSKKKKQQLEESFEPDPRDVETASKYDDAEESPAMESSTSNADKRISMPGGWDEEEPRREDATASENEKKAIPGNSENEPVDSEDVWSGYESKKSKKKKNKRNSVFNEPPISSPLRSEVPRDESSRDKQGPEDVSRQERAHDTDNYTNGHNGVSESPKAMSPVRGIDDYLENAGPDKPLDQPDEFDRDDLDDDKERSGSRRRKHRSRRGDDDDATSTVSTHSRRDKDEPPQSKDKKVGILGSFFGRKSSDGDSLSRTSTRESRSSKDEEDGEHRSHRRRRTGSEYGDDDDSRSTTSSGRRHRQRSEQNEDGDDRHRHRHRDEDEPDGSRYGSNRSQDYGKTNSRNSDDQSFLGERVETLPPLPDSRPASPTSATRNVEQDDGSPASAEADDANKQVALTPAPEPQRKTASSIDLADLPPLPASPSHEPLSKSIELRDLPPLPDSPPRSPLPHAESHYRPFPVPVRPTTASTAVPLRFKQPPPSPHSRSGSIESPLETTTISPVSSQRQKTPRGRTDVHSGEYKPLYLAERHSKPPPIEDDLPSLPSSKPSSRASSVHDNESTHDTEDWHSAAESIYSSPTSQRQLRLDTDLSRLHHSGEDILDSQQTTPRASEFNGPDDDTIRRREPQFYDWEDFMREQARSSQRDRDKPLSPTPISRRRANDQDLDSLPALPESAPVSPEPTIRQHTHDDDPEYLPGLPESRPSSPERVEDHGARAGDVTVGAAILTGIAGVAGVTARHHEESSYANVADTATDRTPTDDLPQRPIDEPAMTVEDAKMHEHKVPSTSTIADQLDQHEQAADRSAFNEPILSRKNSKKAAKKAKKAAFSLGDDEPTPESAITMEQAQEALDDQAFARDQDEMRQHASGPDNSTERSIAVSESTAWDEPEFQTKKKKKGKKAQTKIDSTAAERDKDIAISHVEATEPSFYQADQQTTAPEVDEWDEPEFQVKKKKGKKGKKSKEPVTVANAADIVTESQRSAKAEEIATPMNTADFLSTEDTAELGEAEHVPMPDSLDDVQRAIEAEHFLDDERHIEDNRPLPALPEPTFDEDADLLELEQELEDGIAHHAQSAIKIETSAPQRQDERALKGEEYDTASAHRDDLQEQASSIELPRSPGAEPDQSQSFASRQGITRETDDSRMHRTTSSQAAPEMIVESAQVAEHDPATRELVDMNAERPILLGSDPARQPFETFDLEEQDRRTVRHDEAAGQPIQQVPHPVTAGDIEDPSTTPTLSRKMSKKQKKKQKGKSNLLDEGELDEASQPEISREMQGDAPVEELEERAAIVEPTQKDSGQTTAAPLDEDEFFVPVKKGKKGKKAQRQQTVDLWADDEVKPEPHLDEAAQTTPLDVESRDLEVVQSTPTAAEDEFSLAPGRKGKKGKKAQRQQTPDLWTDDKDKPESQSDVVVDEAAQTVRDNIEAAVSTPGPAVEDELSFASVRKGKKGKKVKQPLDSWTNEEDKPEPESSNFVVVDEAQTEQKFLETEAPESAPVAEDDFSYAPVKKGKRGKKAKQPLDLWPDDQDKPDSQSEVINVTAQTAQKDPGVAAPAPTLTAAEGDDFNFAPVSKGKKGKKAKQQQKLDIWDDDEEKPESHQETLATTPEPETHSASRVLESHGEASSSAMDDVSVHRKNTEMSEIVQEAEQHGTNTPLHSDEVHLPGSDVQQLPELTSQQSDLDRDIAGASAEPPINVQTTLDQDTSATGTPLAARADHSVNSGSTDFQPESTVEAVQGAHHSRLIDPAPIQADDNTLAEDAETAAVSNTTIEEHPADSFPSFVNKKSKKDKRKSKKDADNDETTESNTTKVVPDLLVGAAAATGAAIATAAAAVLPSALIKHKDDVAELPVKKQSKKEKRKSKKSAWLAFDDADDHSANTADEAGQAPMQGTIEDTQIVHGQDSTEQSSQEVTADAAVPVHLAGTDLTEAANLPLPEPVEDELAISYDNERATTSGSDADQEVQRDTTHAGTNSHPDITTDLEFAATLAAGLHNSGFDPNLVVDDPVFHRRASPPGMVAEADPEESVAFGTTKRRKNKSRSPSPEAAKESEQQLPFVGKPSIAPKHQDDFDEILSQSLAASGFDTALLEQKQDTNKKIATEDQQDEADFFTPAKQKRKKGKKALTFDADDGVAEKPLTEVKQHDDFDAVLTDGLAASGFDAALLQQNAASSQGVSTKNQQDDADFFAPVKQKRKKGKKKALAFDYDAASDSSPLPATPAEHVDESKISEMVEVEHQPAPATEEAMSTKPDHLFDRQFPETDTIELRPDFDPLAVREETTQRPATPEWDFPTKSKSKKGKKKQANVVSWGSEIPTSSAEDSTAAVTTRTEPSEDRHLTDVTTVPRDQAMDNDDADEGYKAYKKNRRKAKKEKAAQASLFDERAAASNENLSQHANDIMEPEMSQPRTVNTDMPVHPAQFEEPSDLPLSRPSTPDQRRRRSSKVVVHTSEVSQSSPVAVERSPRAMHRSTSGEHFTTGWSPQHDSYLAEHSDQLLTGVLAAGAATVAGAAMAHHGMEHPRGNVEDKAITGHSDHHYNPMAEEPTWSFSPLQDTIERSPYLDEHEGDHGFTEASSPTDRNTPRSHNHVPVSRPAASHDSLASRRSLEPLHVDVAQEASWDMSMPKQRSLAKTQEQLGAPRSRTPSGETPLEPTSRNRASYLFQTTPETTPEAKGKQVSAEDNTPVRVYQEEHHNAHDEHEIARTAAMSPIARITSPRSALDSIPEESHLSRRNIDASSFVPLDRESKSRRRAFSPDTPATATIRHERALSPNEESKRRVVSTPMNSRLHMEHEGEGKPNRRVFTDPRSSSVLSNRSSASNGVHRIPEDLRSVSRASSGSHTPVLRRISVSGDLRSASRSSNRRGSPKTIPFEPPPTPPLYDEDIIDPGASRAINMSDVFQGYGDRHESHISPTRPPSVRKRQSMHIIELESRLDQLAAENRALAEARREMQDGGEQHGLRRMLEEREFEMREKDVELHRIRTMLGPMQAELERLTEINNGLTEANRNLVDDTNGRYATLQAEHEHAHQQWMGASRELETMRSQQTNLASDVRDAIAPELNAALAEKDHEIRKLREELEIATERIRALQIEIQSARKDSFLVYRDEDYIDGACQKLCQHAQQWVVRFSKTSDNRVCRLSSQLGDEKIETRLDNAILDGSDVDKLLADRIKRRDVLMSVVTTMIWEYVFTRYLFGMDREQRQKLKALEKTLAEVGPPRAVAQWRATTLTLLCKRQSFEEQCALDTEAVAHEIYGVLCSLLPPPASAEQQLLLSLQRVVKVAVDLSIEMRTQKAEYIMLPPLQPEYDDNGDLRSKMFFNSQLMNERSGNYSSNEELEAERAVVKLVLFPPVIKKGDDFGEGSEETVVCPAQVLIHNDGGKSKKVVRVMSGAMDIDDPRASRQSLISTVPGNSTI